MTVLIEILQAISRRETLPLHLAVQLSGIGLERAWTYSSDAVTIWQILHWFHKPLPAMIAVDVAAAASERDSFAMGTVEAIRRIIRLPLTSAATSREPHEIVSLFHRAVGISVGSSGPIGARWQCVRYAILAVGYELGEIERMNDNGVLTYLGQSGSLVRREADDDPRDLLFAVLDSAHTAGADWQTLARILRKSAAAPTLEQIIAASVS